MYINYSEGWLPDEHVIELMNKAGESVLENEGIDSRFLEISLTFADSDEIRELNLMHRNVNSVTDVLSFPQYEDMTAIRDEIAYEEDSEVHENIHITLGDVVICPQRAEEQAREYGHSIERELVYLFTHSMLHLLGYDHEEQDEKDEMRLAEDRVMDAVGLKR